MGPNNSDRTTVVIVSLSVVSALCFLSFGQVFTGLLVALGALMAFRSHGATSETMMTRRQSATIIFGLAIVASIHAYPVYAVLGPGGIYPTVIAEAEAAADRRKTARNSDRDNSDDPTLTAEARAMEQRLAATPALMWHHPSLILHTPLPLAVRWRIAGDRGRGSL